MNALTQLTAHIPLQPQRTAVDVPVIEVQQEVGCQADQQSHENKVFEAILCEALQASLPVASRIQLAQTLSVEHAGEQISSPWSVHDGATPTTQASVADCSIRQAFLVDEALYLSRTPASDHPQGQPWRSQANIVGQPDLTRRQHGGLHPQVQTTRVDPASTSLREHPPFEISLTHTARHSLLEQDNRTETTFVEAVRTKRVSDHYQGKIIDTMLLQLNSWQSTNRPVLFSENQQIANFGQPMLAEWPCFLTSAPGEQQTQPSAAKVPYAPLYQQTIEVSPLEFNPVGKVLSESLASEIPLHDDAVHAAPQSFTSFHRDTVHRVYRDLTSAPSDENHELTERSNHLDISPNGKEMDQGGKARRLENPDRLTKQFGKTEVHSVDHDLQGIVSSLRTERSFSEPFAQPPQGSLSLLTPEEARDIMGRVAQEIKLCIQDHRAAVRIQLRPESLGTIIVTVYQEEATVTAQIHVEHAGVKTAIETQLPQLRQALTDQGVDVRGLEVLMTDQSMAREFRWQPQPRSKRRAADTISVIEEADDPLSPRSLGYNTIELFL